MRVVITVASLAPEYGGPSAKALNLASALLEFGHDVSVFGGGQGQVGGTGLGSIGRFHGTPIPRHLAPALRAVRACDVLHVLGVRDPVGTTAALAARMCRVPYVVEPAGMLQPRLRSFLVKRAYDLVAGNRVIRGATIVVATSAPEGRELAAAGVDSSRICLRYNGVDLSSLFPLPVRGSLRGRLGIPAEAPLLLTVGRIAAIKGLEHIAEAIARVPDAYWVVAGPDEEDGTLALLRRTIRALDLNDRVTILTEGLWGGAKAEALADADAFCMASANESFGTAAAEAACAGLPLAIAEHCGVLDCLEPTALRTFRYGDIDGITAAVTWALHDPDGRRAGAEAARSIRDRLDWMAVVRQQVAIYNAARARPRRATPKKREQHTLLPQRNEY